MRKIINLGFLTIDTRKEWEKNRYEDREDGFMDYKGPNRKIRLGFLTIDMRTNKERLEDVSQLVEEVKRNLSYFIKLGILYAKEYERRQNGLAPAEYLKNKSDDEILRLRDVEWEYAEIIDVDQLEQLCLKKDLLRARLYRYKD